MSLTDLCVPISADVVLMKVLAREPLVNVCVLCACTRSLLKMDNTNYVHLNDEYIDRRLTLRQLVKETQYEEFVDDSKSPAICESCVNHLCNLMLFKNKCHVVNTGLTNLVRIINEDLLEKVVNVATGMPATVLPYEQIHQYCKNDEIDDLKDIIDIQAGENSDDESDIVTKYSKTIYKCTICATKLKKREVEEHTLFHYYKSVLEGVVLKKRYCICCLREDQIVTDIVMTAENEGDMTLSDVFFEIFDHEDVNNLGEVEICTGCFSKIVNVYNFKKMFHASATIIKDCVHALEVSLQDPKQAIKVTEQEKYTVSLLSVYNTLQTFNKDRIQTVVPFLKALKRSATCTEIIQPKPFRKNQRLRFDVTKRLAKNRYKCSICGRITTTLVQARDHRLDHCKPRKMLEAAKEMDVAMACHICGGEFTEVLELNAHIMSKHADIVFCPYCEKSYKIDRNDLYRPHVELCKTIKKPYTCDLCKACFITNKKLTAHRIKHFPRTYKCDFCAKKFWTMLEVRGHQTKSHKQVIGLKFECSMCDEDFDSKLERTAHMDTHDTNSRHVCRFCKSTFNMKTNYIAHQCTGKILHKRKCEQKLDHVSISSELIDSDHDNKCTICNKVLKTARYLEAHMKMHLDKKRHVYFACAQCDYRTRFKRSLEAHINRHHLTVKPFECKICPKSFYSKPSLMQHNKLHKETSTVDVNEDNKDIFIATETQVEIRQQKPECHICNETFSSDSDAQYHRLNKHSDMPQVQCENCSETFTTEMELKTHTMNTHACWYPDQTEQ